MTLAMRSVNSLAACRAPPYPGTFLRARRRLACVSAGGPRRGRGTACRHRRRTAYRRTRSPAGLTRKGRSPAGLSPKARAGLGESPSLRDRMACRQRRAAAADPRPHGARADLQTCAHRTSLALGALSLARARNGLSPSTLIRRAAPESSPAACAGLPARAPAGLPPGQLRGVRRLGTTRTTALRRTALAAATPVFHLVAHRALIAECAACCERRPRLFEMSGSGSGPFGRPAGAGDPMGARAGRSARRRRTRRGASRRGRGARQ